MLEAWGKENCLPHDEQQAKGAKGWSPSILFNSTSPMASLFPTSLHPIKALTLPNRAIGLEQNLQYMTFEGHFFKPFN
jgi:hypothetical protein